VTETPLHLFNPDYADMANALLVAGAEMKRNAVAEKPLYEGKGILCPELSAAERLAVLVELNRIGLAALGLEDAPLERSAVRMRPVRESPRRTAPAPA